MGKKSSKLFYLSLFSLAMLTAQSTMAAGYKSEFQSASTLADAGDAAIAEDAGTNWYNAAGLVNVPHQLVYTGFDVYAPTYFRGTATAPALVGPGFSGSGRASSYPNLILPSFHYALPLSNQFSVGLSVNPAWGFTEDYGIHSVVRYNLWRVISRSLDVTPSLAFRVGPQLSIGLGPDFHFFSVWSRNSVLTPIQDSVSTFSASNWGHGAHIGALFSFNDATRVGLNYRTRMTMRLDGDSEFYFGTLGGLESKTNDFKIKVALPSITTFSMYHDFTPCIAATGTLNYERWSELHRYVANNLQGPLAPTIPEVILPQNMHDTLDVSVGSLFKLNERVTLKGSVKVLPTPTRTAFRGVNFPDGAKIGVQIGGRYQYSKHIALDGIYGHVFVKDTRINDVNPVTGSHLVGVNKTHIDFIGGQLIWNI